jgi:hypothetical protein
LRPRRIDDWAHIIAGDSARIAIFFILARIATSGSKPD